LLLSAGVGHNNGGKAADLPQQSARGEEDMLFARRGITRALLASASLFSLGVIAEPATAQTQVADASTGSSSGVETVTVTATRRAVDAQKVAVSLTAISAEQLQAQAPHTLQDLNGAAPNVFIGNEVAGPAQSAIFIRGQGYADVEKTQATPVGVVQDGVSFDNNTGQLLDMFDVCSVEVDSGPQGIFYGKNTSAGLINITRCAPTREWGANVSAAYGSYKAPLGEDGGIKVSGQWHSNGGFLENVYSNEHTGGQRYWALNAVIDYDLTSWLNVNFSYDHDHQNGQGDPVSYGDVLTAKTFGFTALPGYNPQTGSPDGLKPYQVENRPGDDTDRFNNDIYSLILKAKTPIGDLVSQTAFINEADDVKQDYDATCFTDPGCPNTTGNLLFGPLPLQVDRLQKYQQFTQEVRLTGTIWDNFDYIAGMFFDHHDIDLGQITDSAIYQTSSEGDYSWSEFGNIDWNVTDAIKLSAGVRNISETARFSTFYDYFNNPLLVLVPEVHDRHSWNKAITRFNAQWQVTPDTMLYANRSEGFRSGGFSIRGTLSEAAPGQTNYAPGNNFLTFLPESNVTYEAGAKNEFFNDSLTFNFDGFINNITDMQQTEVVETGAYGPGTNTYVVNFPKVQIKGLEFQADAKVGNWVDSLDGLTLSANLGLQSAKVKSGIINGEEASLGAGGTAGGPGSVADFTGSTLQRVPSNNFTIRGTYVHSVGSDSNLTLSAGYARIAHFSLATIGTAPDIQPGYGLLDASARFDWQNYYIQLSGKNLTDTTYRVESLPTVFFQSWGVPRTVEVEVGAKF
jgi:iron complex outermembrane receptor protein